LASPKKKRERKATWVNSRKVKYNILLQMVYGKKFKVFFSRDKLPMLSSVPIMINNNHNFLNFKRSTFYLLLKAVTFVFEKKGRKVREDYIFLS
jgi:hypothetical protein